MSVEIPNDGSPATWHDYNMGPVELKYENLIEAGPCHDLRVMTDRVGVTVDGEASAKVNILLTEDPNEPYDMMLGLNLNHGDDLASLYTGIEPQNAREVARYLLAAADYIEEQRQRSD